MPNLYTCVDCGARISITQATFSRATGEERAYCPRSAEFRRKWTNRGIGNMWGDIWNFPPEMPKQEMDACKAEYHDLLKPASYPTKTCGKCGKQIELAIWYYTDEYGQPQHECAACRTKFENWLYGSSPPTLNATGPTEDTKEKGDATMRVEMTDNLFGKAEEGDDDTKIRRGGFDIYEGGKVVARCRAAVTEDSDGKVKFSYAIGPAKDFGFDATKEGEFEGDVAAAFFELIGAARECVDNPRARGRGHDSSAFSLDINL